MDSTSVLFPFLYTHLLELARVDDPLKRAFYELECIKSGWAVRELKRQRDSTLYERVGLFRDQECRWSHFKNLTPAKEMLKLVRDRVFPQSITGWPF